LSRSSCSRFSPEPTTPGSIGGTYGPGRTGLRHREQAHPTRLSPRPGAGRADLGADLVDPRADLDLDHGQRAPSETAASAARIPKIVAMPAYFSAISASTLPQPTWWAMLS
jgi:hypothetical protein